MHGHSVNHRLSLVRNDSHHARAAAGDLNSDGIAVGQNHQLRQPVEVVGGQVTREVNADASAEFCDLWQMVMPANPLGQHLNALLLLYGD